MALWFGTALLLTLLVELPLLVMSIRWLPARIRPAPGRTALAGVLASTATLPYLWFIVPELFPSNAFLQLAGGEALVTAAEAAIYSFVLDLPLPFSATVSTVCNVASCLFGLALWRMM